MPRLCKGSALLRFGLSALLAVGATLFCLSAAAATSKPVVPVVFIYQPLASPGGALAAALKRDRILHRALERSGLSLQMRPVKSGAEAQALLASGDAQIATLGDMPLLKAACEMQLCAVALIKQNYASVVGPRGFLPGDLKGKRIGNAHGTSSHFALMKALASAGLSEADALLVPMEVTEMEDALVKGKIDAYAAWAPTPGLTLARYPERFAAIGKQKSLAFVAVSKQAVQSHPELARELAAALLRAMNWFRDDKALERGADWNLADIKALQANQSRQIGRSRLVQDLRADLKAVGHTPRLPRGIDAEGSSLAEEFQFLKKLGKIPAPVAWPDVKGIFSFEALQRVQKNPGKYQTSRFDYDQN